MPEGWISWKDAALQEAAEGPISRSLRLPGVGTEQVILDRLSCYPRLMIDPALQRKLEAAGRICPIKRGWSWGVKGEYRNVTFFNGRKFFPGGNPTLRSDWDNFALLHQGQFMTLWEALELLTTLREPFNPARERGLIIPCAQTGGVDGPPFSLHITASIREEEGQIRTGPWTMLQACFEEYSFGHGSSMSGHRIALITDPSVGLIEGWLRGR
jgi:hypothetical protein